MDCPKNALHGDNALLLRIWVVKALTELSKSSPPKYVATRVL